MEKKFKVLASIGLSLYMPLLANVALPSMYEILGFSVKANGITLLGFSLEFLCVCIMAHALTLNLFGRAFFCTIVMNAFSAVIGFFLRAPFALLIGSIVYNRWDISPLQAWSIMLISFVTINTLLEGYIARNLFFPKIPTRRFWFWIMMANLLSNGIGLWLANSYMKIF